MKVLLICFILTIGCQANEESNITSTTPAVLTFHFESLKLVNETNTTPVSNVNITTNKPDLIKNGTTEEPITFKKKPQLKATKLKKLYKTNQTTNFYRVHEVSDLNREESKFNRKNSYSMKPKNLHNFLSEYTEPRNNSMTYKTYHDSKKEESRVTQKFLKPDAIVQQPRSRHYSHIDRNRWHNSQRFNKNNSEDFRDSQESRRNENYIQYSYKYKPDLQHTRTVSDHLQQETESQPRPGGRPTLPEIQNVIHTLDSQDSAPVYKSPKQNHIVEVTEVPLVFEHHYQGDYKNPESNFVAHQYSYSPPADTTDEAYRLGKILSQNVVQKLESSEQPLQEYVQNQQEVILAGYTNGVPSYSYVNFNLNPVRTSLENTQPVHPIMKYLAPEITPQSFGQEIQHFQPAQLSQYQVATPQAQMQPIVVAEDESTPQYGTTFLQAIGGAHQTNTQQHIQTIADAGQSYQQNFHQQQQPEENTEPKSPYSVNVQQHFVNIPKYTLAKFSKPQAIHEVEPPNLSGHSNENNYNSIRYHIASAIPTASSENIRNPGYGAVQAEHEDSEEQEEQVENPNVNYRVKGVIPSTKLVHYIVPQQSPTAAPIIHRPRTQMNPSRPYWRKPAVMKLVRIPGRNTYQQEEQTHQSQYQSYRQPEESTRTRNQQLYQSLAEHYSSPVKHQEQHNGYSGNIMRLVPQQTSQHHEGHHQFSSRPIVVEEVYGKGQNQGEEPSYSQSSYGDQNDHDNVRYQNIDEPNYSNERPEENVEIVKSISHYIPQQPEENTRENSVYDRPSPDEDSHSSELPKGYLSYQQQRNRPRGPHMMRVENTRHIMPLVRYRNRENYETRTRIMNPRIRRLVSDLLRDSYRRQNVYVVMTEDE